MHLPEYGLAKFCLTYFAVKGQIFKDGLLATTVLLMNCTLDDTRLSREGSLTRIMERTSEVPQMIDFDKEKGSKKVRNMINITIMKDANDMFGEFKNIDFPYFLNNFIFLSFLTYIYSMI